MKMNEISSVNKTLVDPLRKCHEEQQELRKKVDKFQKEKRSRQVCNEMISIYKLLQLCSFCRI